MLSKKKLYIKFIVFLGIVPSIFCVCIISSRPEILGVFYSKDPSSFFLSPLYHRKLWIVLDSDTIRSCQLASTRSTRVSGADRLELNLRSVQCKRFMIIFFIEVSHNKKLTKLKPGLS